MINRLINIWYYLFIMNGIIKDIFVIMKHIILEHMM